MAEQLSRGWFSEWGLLTKEWVIGAFCAATLDWMASKIPIRNGIFATLLSTAQLTTTYFLVNGLRGLLGTGRRDVIYLADNWLLFNTIWTMSPTAVNRLSGSYRKLHMILYGSAPLPQTLVPGACTTGNCEAKQ